ncbi:MAG: IPT/TIG domain-containing protein [Acidobacteria bacterium]|nr:IPT/TIG domain-containing protein [Acidobacteriota bacterium]
MSSVFWVPASLTSASFLPLQSASFSIVERTPVVNEGNQLRLTVIDATGQPISGVVWESGSPEIVTVESQTGVLHGVLQGVATVTARRNAESTSVFVVVTRVSSNRGATVPGETKVDTRGRVYLTDPVNSVVLRKESLSAPAQLFAGSELAHGHRDGNRLGAWFAGPTAATIDNGALGGVYVADTLNHCIRKVGYDDQVSTVVGNGTAGILTADITPLSSAVLRGPRGVAIDTGGNLFVADTENNAIFYVDFNRQEIRLLAGMPGEAGLADGTGRTARFAHPRGLALSPDGRLLAVADEGNRVVRLVSKSGVVKTVGRQSAAREWKTSSEDEFLFQAPQSVSFDGQGNLCVVDKAEAYVVTNPETTSPERIPLAQPGVSFGQAVSVTVRGYQTFVLDAQAASPDEAVKVVTIGPPRIKTISRTSDQIEGGAEVVVDGQNFGPETHVLLGDRLVEAAVIESATRLRFHVPPQNAPGKRTLSIQTRGGLVQQKFEIFAKTFEAMAAGEITTVAGGVPYSGDSGVATLASLKFPRSIAIDGAGNMFIADRLNHRVRRVDAISGIISTVAGTGAAAYNGDGQPALSASLNFPTGVAVDHDGNVWIADQLNHRIRRVDAMTGIITTVGGTGVAGLSGDGGPATNAQLNSPQAIVFDSAENVFLTDLENHAVRRIDAMTGVITTVAGTGISGFGGDNDLAQRARLNQPYGLAVDQFDNLFIADTGNHRVRRVDAGSGVITTVAGNGIADFHGDGGPAPRASLNQPYGVTIDLTGNLIIVDRNNGRIRRVDFATQVMSTVAGNGSDDFSGDGGPAVSAGLLDPEAVAVDGNGRLFIADTENNRVRLVSPDGVIQTVVGTEFVSGDGGPAINASLSNPFKVLIDHQGNLIIADSENNRVRRVDRQTWIIHGVAGNGVEGDSGDGGPAVLSRLHDPEGLAIDRAGNLYIADQENNRIRRINAATGVIVNFAGNGQAGFAGDGGLATLATLNSPRGITIDVNDNLYLADRLNHRIRRVDAQTGVITTIAGMGTAGFTGDGGPAMYAHLNSPEEIVFDQQGNLLIADLGNHRIRRIDARTSIITTIAGVGIPGFSGDGGPAMLAQLNSPHGIAVDGAGNLFIADRDNHRLRRVDAQTGIISTIAGTGEQGYSGDGQPASECRLNYPLGLVIDGEGNLWLASGFNDAIRVIRQAAVGLQRVTITQVNFQARRLTITGTGFGSTGAQVLINGTDATAFLKSQTDTSLMLKGKKKKLGLINGTNLIRVIAGGVSSNQFEFDISRDEF